MSEDSRDEQMKTDRLHLERRISDLLQDYRDEYGIDISDISVIDLGDWYDIILYADEFDNE